jgi:hypothetical protein
LSKLAFRTTLIWTADARSAVIAGPGMVPVASNLALFIKNLQAYRSCDTVRANLDSTVPKLEPGFGTGNMLIGGKGLSPSK